MQSESTIPQVSDGRREREKGIILLLGTLSIPVLVSMMGMGIDAGLLYSVRGRMQLSADGASLAAARALSLGQTTAQQAASAQANATNWFNRNFPSGTMGAYNIVLDPPQVFDDPIEPLVRHVVVTAASDAPSYFMRFWGRVGTTVRVSSDATRRDAVIMMVLDRSGSMNAGNACAAMRNAAKQFTGLFAAGRDRIGMISYSDTVYLHSSPTTNFQSILGYTDPVTGANYSGEIDTITCANWTATPGATILGYNEVYKMGLPGALNVVLLFTDGVPNTMVIDARGGTTNVRGALADAARCQDSTGRRVDTGAPNPPGMGHLSNNPPQWSSQIDLGAHNFFRYLPTPPANITGQYLSGGPIGGVVDSQLWRRFWATSTANSFNSNWMTTAGCGNGTSWNTVPTALEWIPNTDVFGNIMNDPSYLPLTTGTFDGATRIQATSANWTNAAYNASAAAANTSRTARTLWDGRAFPGVYVFAIGLGDVDHGLLQRMANDPNPDPGGAYGAYPGYNTNQPQGVYVYANDSSRLGPAFVQLASFILRLAN